MKRFSLLTLVFLCILGTWLMWQWCFCRFYVPPGYMAVVIAKSGENLPPGQILAGPKQRGIREQVLAEGRHFLNPIEFDHEIRPVVTIPPGKVGVVTAKVGSDLPPGEFLAEKGQKGVWRDVIGPGTYRMNPYGYEIEIADALSVPIGYVGVITSLAGAQAPPGEFAGPKQKGIRKDILQPGLYFLNPKALKCDVLEVGVNQVSLLGHDGGQVITKRQIQTNEAMQSLQSKALEEQQERRQEYFKSAPSQSRASSLQPAPQKKKLNANKTLAPQRPVAPEAALSVNQQVEFPSRDGFAISLDMTVEFELLPENIAWIYRSYGDLPAVVEKILMPQILSISRLKGSAYGAKEFIVGEGREAFQKGLTEALAKTLLEKKILIHNALIRQVNVPTQILEPIQQASVAVVRDRTNQEQQNTAKKQAELNMETSLIEQRRQEVEQQTEKLKAEILADQNKEVAETQAETQRKVSEIEKQTALVAAEKTRKLGDAKARVINFVEGERAHGFELKAKAYGDPQAYALQAFAASLNPDVKINILHSGPGTLWTDLDKSGMSAAGAARILQAPASPAKR